MPQCNACKKFYPPDFVVDIPEDKARLCLFCKRGKEEIRYGKNNEKTATRKEIIEEYQMFLRMVKERNEILKKSLVGEDIQDKDRPLKILE